MSVLERRLQLLLDQARYDLVEQEARRSGRSVAAVIRAAIDLYFGQDVEVRSAAAHRLLAMTSNPRDREPDWAQSKALLEGSARLDRIP